MGLTQKQKADYKKQILNDYPRLNEIESVVDTLIDLYDKDEKGFQEQVKKEMNDDRKKKKKQGADTQPPAKSPEDYILHGLMEKIEAKDVKKGIDYSLKPPPRDMSGDDIQLGEDGMIKL
jgi:hypothetical protein